jgi:putative transcriptional regulator
MIKLPSDEILLKYASGVLNPALRLLVDRHIALHPQTAERLAAFNQFGGMLLAAEEPVALTAGSLDRALARIAAAPQDAPPAPAWPALDSLRWRWAGPGRRIARVNIDAAGMSAYALKIASGKAMLQHSHAGREWTLVVQGAYRDESGEYGPGAFVEEDGETIHKPVAIGDVDCICLAVLSAPLTAPGLMGMAAQWLMR